MKKLSLSIAFIFFISLFAFSQTDTTHKQDSVLIELKLTQQEYNFIMQEIQQAEQCKVLMPAQQQIMDLQKYFDSKKQIIALPNKEQPKR